MISFVTIFAHDIERTADIYRLLGCEFVTERHGSGPEHLACTSGATVLEIYPGKDVVGSGIMIGVDVANLDHARESVLAAGIPLWRDVEPGMRRMIVKDPEGRSIFVREGS
ncbi:glyoxalase [Mesorhizobium sp. M1E.F.Ca.ET.045.02.1.1]|uniref:VOC family protein n=1 Tax=unclassified Mesorhizobium TaxID=325217 RepID=UPI000F757917|nr:MULTISPECIES: glyoxalase [unclassified Mesorhizobium]AZO20197.1 glyoxalase [Mesorhizobium sp. M1E.F.Ca.ET.045.02.1.1]RUW67842.1 glyoxalase [Mesorhizobium sp. M1E.F.Ca.ET.063.01.1.1]